MITGNEVPNYENVTDMTELQNNCACVTNDPVGARGRENLDLSNTFPMKDQS